MKPSLREAYEKLGLSPFAEFLDLSSGDHKVGSTTWMTVEAALVVVGGNDVLLVAGSLQQAVNIAKTCLDYVLKLQGGMGVRTHSLGPSSRFYSVQGAGNIHWESSRTLKNFWLGRRQEDFTVFRDVDFQAMALQRRDGPFAEIRRLDRKPDWSYAAYTATGEYLFDLTDKGARQIADADPYRVVVND